MGAQGDVMEIASRLRTEGEAFALATVVRTVSVTAAKAGAKAVIRPDGTVSGGWIGGGCARAAVVKAAREAIADGEPRLVSVQPEDALAGRGVKAGESVEGVRFARNMCPSQGTMDIFVEPVLPRPVIALLGSSPVAVALAGLARSLGYRVTVCAPAAEQGEFAEADRRIDGFSLPADPATRLFVVVSTQGRGDEAALKAALAAQADYRAFVGSGRKFSAIRRSLVEAGVEASLIDTVKAPAGLDIGAITPDEIALSILSEITRERRRGVRGEPGAAQ